VDTLIVEAVVVEWKKNGNKVELKNKNSTVQVVPAKHPNVETAVLGMWVAGEIDKACPDPGGGAARTMGNAGRITEIIDALKNGFFRIDGVRKTQTATPE
jgi:hypothetical protein